MSKEHWVPPDDFYKGYSLYQQFGYGPEGEFNITRNILQQEGYPTGVGLIRETLELTRVLADKIQETCETEIDEYEKVTRRAYIAGGVVPAHIQVAKAIIIRILKMAAGKIKAIVDRLTTSEDERIITKIIEKLETDKETKQIIIKSTKTYRNTYQIEKRDKNET